MDIFGNHTAPIKPTWVPEPNSRGTWGIISSCLLTLCLCLWTALHLNVPISKHEQTWLKASWLLVGLLAPEFVVYNAWAQWTRVRSLTKTMNASSSTRSPTSPQRSNTLHQEEGQPGHESETKVDSRNDWTTKHSYYAQMGGFVFDFTERPFTVLPNGSQKVYLTPNGSLFLGKYFPEVLPRPSIKFLEDKSKADGLAKTLVCLQALWFSVQCLNRMIAHGKFCFISLMALTQSLA